MQRWLHGPRENDDVSDEFKNCIIEFASPCEERSYRWFKGHQKLNANRFEFSFED